MIEVRIPFDGDFEYEKCKSLYRKCQRYIGDDQPFRAIINNTYFYSFYLDGVLIGCIYCFYRGDDLYLNGFATRHHHEANMEAMRMVLSYFDCDIYSESIRKTAIYCLLELGFKKQKGNIYKYERK